MKNLYVCNFHFFMILVTINFINGCAFNIDENTKKEEETKAYEAQKELVKKQWYKNTKGNLASPKKIKDEVVETHYLLGRHESKIEHNSFENKLVRTNLETENIADNLFNNIKKNKIELNFNNAEIQDVISVVAKYLKINYQIDNNIKEKLTLYINEELTDYQLWNILKNTLYGLDIYPSINEKIINFKKISTLKQDNSVTKKTKNVKLAVYNLKNINAKESLNQIMPYITKGNKPILIEKSNKIIITDLPEVIDKINMIITEIDQPIKKGWYKLVIPCKNIEASQIAVELSNILPVLGFPVSTESKTNSEDIQITTIKRLQTLIVSCANSNALKQIKQWVSLLDQIEDITQEKIYIYEIINNNAEELLRALSVIFAVEGTGYSSVAGNNSSSTSSSAKSTLPNTNTKGNHDEISSIFEIPVKIFADITNERLIIRTKPRVYAMMKALLEKIDTIPSQVLLQVSIIDVLLSDSVNFGVEFMTHGTYGNTEIAGGTNYSGLAPNSGQDGQSGGRFYIFNPKNPDQQFGYINALAGKTNIKIISNPQLLILSKHEAQISIGNKVPIVNSEITNTQSIDTADTNLIRNIQYQDTGVILKVKPQITRGGRISIDIEQTVSDADENSTSNIDSPIIKEQIIKTTMSIKNGQTIICGGMIREKTSDVLSTLPILGSIPYIRRLVGDTSTSSDRTELMILITGTIITEKSQLEKILEEYHDAMDILIDYKLPKDQRIKKINQEKGLVEKWFIE